MYRMIPGLIVLVLAFVAACGFAQEPSESSLLKEAAIPPLVIGATPSVPFVVNGKVPIKKGKGIAFQLATDGKKQRVILYDLADGTPIFLSDGEQTLLYDLDNARIIRWKDSVARIWIDYNLTKEREINFQFVVRPKASSDTPRQSGVALDQFVKVNLAKLKKQAGKNGETIFIAQRESRTATIRKAPNDTTWFRFTIAEMESPSLELDARSIGKSLPHGALTFPDTAKLAQEISVFEMDAEQVSALFTSITTGSMFASKFNLMVETGAQDLPQNVDWDALRKRDAKLGAQYRAALTKQGIRFTGFESLPQNPKTH